MKKLMVSVAGLALAFAPAAIAEVSSEQAAQLGAELTPLGGEVAGNEDGSIPAWTGGYQGDSTGPMLGDIPTGLFAGDEPIYTVNAANMGEYADLLSDGTRALLEAYPETYELQVYETRRTANASNEVYAATRANATNCTLTENGLSMEGCIGGVPFPIPQNGFEVIWNYLMRIEAPSVEYTFRNIVGNSDGSHTLATRNEIAFQYPFYYDAATPESFEGEYAMFRFNTLEPPFKAGESLVARDSIDVDRPRMAWQYLVGQRRVRRAPTVSYDTPDFVASGANYFDEVQGFFGAIDRFDWELVGRRELLVPYNNNGFVGASLEEALDEHHHNPDHVRWERHRVWEVRATVADGKRHAVPNRTYYFDEDSFLLTLMDGYDSEGTLWRTTQMTNFYVPAVPALLNKTATVFNLQANTMSVIQILNEESFEVVETKPESYFTGDAVAMEAVR